MEPVQKIERSDEEWRKELTPEQYRVLREEGTERAGSSPLRGERRKGVYACAACGLPLFHSAAKFNSGTGWPCFYNFIEGHLEFRRDVGPLGPRTSYHCARCDGHQGHVYDDGPPPTGKRYCNNGVALRFEPQGSSSRR